MTASAEQWLKDSIEAINSKDIDKIVDCSTDDCVWENVAAGNVINGKEELRNYFQDLFTAFPDFKVELKSCFAVGNQVCAETILSGTHKGKMQNVPIPPTGKTWSVRSVRVIELKEDKGYRSTVYFDMASFMRQLGVLPQPQT